MSDAHGGGKGVGVVGKGQFAVFGVFFEIYGGVGAHEFAEIAD